MTESTRFRTGEVRLSYLDVFQGKVQTQGKSAGKTKYSAAILIPKSDTETLRKAKAARDKVLADKFGLKPPKIANPIKDGDGEKPRGGEYGEECKGHWVINAGTYIKPTVIHRRDIHKQLSEGEIVSGDYALVILEAYWFEGEGNKGVTYSLGNICMTRQGEPLGSRRSAESDFGDIAEAGGGASNGDDDFLD